MGVAIPTVLAGPGSEFTANVIIFQGHPRGSVLLSWEDVTTTVRRDKGEGRKGNEKRRLGSFHRPRKGGKKEGICVFRTADCVSLAQGANVRTCQTHQHPLIQSGFHKSGCKVGHGLKWREGNSVPLEHTRGIPCAGFAGCWRGAR